MINETLLYNDLVMSRAELLVYLLLAVIFGWAIRSLFRKTWWHRFWEHGNAHYYYPQRGHTYLEYVPEIPRTVKPQAYVPPVAPSDDLTIIEGIGPVIESLLKSSGVMTWATLAKTPLSELRMLLDRSGAQGASHDPSSWPQQAHLAATGQWEELKNFQAMLTRGRM